MHYSQKFKTLSFLKLCLNADSFKTDKVPFSRFLKIVKAYQYCARDSAKLTPGYNLARVKPLSLYGVELSGRDE